MHDVDRQKEIQRYLLVNFCEKNRTSLLVETKYCRNLLNQGHAMIEERGKTSTKHLTKLEQNMAYKAIIMPPA